MRKLGRKKSHREHLIRNLATSLVLFESIDTTEAKAKEVKNFLGKILSEKNEDDLNSIRRINSYFFDDNASKKVVLELLPRYKERNSGFIKSYKLKNRLGDNAPMMRLELVDKKVFKSEEKLEDKNTKEKIKETENKDAKTRKSK